jgi:hypothetical protein
MAFVAFLLRVFVAQPIGALLALIIGTVWCLGNAERIQGIVRRIVGR